MEKSFFNPAETHNMPQFYSQAVSIRDGGIRTIYISGQVGVDAQGKLAGDGGLADQAARAFANLDAVLRAAGATAKDVVKITVFSVGLDGPKSAIIGGAMLKHFPGPDQPASTWIGVTSLVGKGYLLEVEATAVVKA
jgi:enamine deaminase RidA (YjgF/YER057c/UK114 family)